MIFFQVLPPSVRAVNRRAGAAVDDGPDVATALIAGRDEHIGVARIEHDIGDAGVVVDLQNLVPRLAAVGRLVESAIAALLPERPLRRDVDRVRIARVDQDFADVFAGLEADIPPRLPAVGALVNAVAVADAALAVVLARADPEHTRVLGVHRDAADRIRALVVEHRRPGGAGVGGLPDAARSDGDEKPRAIARINGKANDATRGHGRPDQPRLERTDRERLRILLLLGRVGGLHRHEGEREDESGGHCESSSDNG